MDDEIPGPGDNFPPDDIEILRQNLTERNADLLARRDELLAAVERVPETIDDADNASRTADFIKQLSAGIKESEARRVAAKEPYLASGRAVDGIFKPIADALGKAKTLISRRLTEYQRKVAEAEKLRREEEARRQQEAAEQAAREAAEKAALAQSETDLDKAIAAEEAAKLAAADAHAAQQAADAKPAELSRARTDHGATYSLRTKWDFEITDADKLPLDILRPHIPRDALEKAIRAFVKAGGRELAGARIFESTQTVV